MALLANFLALLINVSISFVISLKSSLILNSCNNSSIVKYFNFKESSRVIKVGLWYISGNGVRFKLISDIINCFNPLNQFFLLFL